MKENVRGRSRRKKDTLLSRTLHGSFRRFMSAAVCTSLVLNSVVSSAFTALAMEPEDRIQKFRLESRNIYEEIQRAAIYELPVDENELFDDSESGEYITLPDDGGELYELDPKVVEDGGRLDLRVFARLDQESQEDIDNYEMTGSEEIIFLLVNDTDKNLKGQIFVDDMKTEEITVIPESKVKETDPVIARKNRLAVSTPSETEEEDEDSQSEIVVSTPSEAETENGMEVSTPSETETEDSDDYTVLPGTLYRTLHMEEGTAAAFIVEAEDLDFIPADNIYVAETENAYIHAQVSEEAFDSPVTFIAEELPEDTEAFAQAEESLKEKAAEKGCQVEDFLAFDVRFENENGEETEPGRPVSVTIEMKNDQSMMAEALEENNIVTDMTVIHIHDEKVKELDTTVEEEDGVLCLSVEMEQFSILMAAKLTRALEEVYVSPDGEGDGLSAENPMSLHTAVNKLNAADGGIINLAAGEYQIDKIYVDEAIQFAGSGKEDTKIIVNAEAKRDATGETHGFDIRQSITDGTISFKDLSIEAEDEEIYGVLQLIWIHNTDADGVTVEIENCSLKNIGAGGAYRHAVSMEYANGESKYYFDLTIRECEIETRSYGFGSGLNNGNPDVSDCTFHSENTEYSGESSGSIYNIHTPKAFKELVVENCGFYGTGSGGIKYIYSETNTVQINNNVFDKKANADTPFPNSGTYAIMGTTQTPNYSNPRAYSYATEMKNNVLKGQNTILAAKAPVEVVWFPDGYAANNAEVNNYGDENVTDTGTRYAKSMWGGNKNFIVLTDFGITEEEIKFESITASPSDAHYVYNSESSGTYSDCKEGLDTYWTDENPAHCSGYLADFTAADNVTRWTIDDNTVADFKVNHDGTVTIIPKKEGVTYLNAIVGGGENGTIPNAKTDRVRIIIGDTSVDPINPEDWEKSKSKTAANLDEKFESDVTLSLPAADYKPVVDVAFVIDATSLWRYHNTEIVNAVRKMADELAAKDNIRLNVGVVAFGNETRTLFDMQEVTGQNVDALISKIKGNSLTYYINRGWISGTDIQLGVREGKKMLDESISGAEPGDKYMLLLTDGGSFWYCGEDGTSVNRILNSDGNIMHIGNMDGNNDVGGAGRINSSAYLDSNNFADFMETHGKYIEQSLDGSYSKADLSAGITQEMRDKAVTGDVVRDRVRYPYLNMERGTYLAARELLKVRSEGYKLLTVGYYGYFPELKSLNAVAEGFLDWTGNDGIGTVYDGDHYMGNAFDDLANQLIYLVDAGSKVVDEMGKTGDYDFDFIQDADRLVLTVGGQKYAVEEVAAEGGETSAYVFGEANAEGVYPFALHYYKNGTADRAGEHFVWDINVPVTRDEKVQLTYGVKLINPKTAAGSYGDYDWDGSKGSEGLYTNNEAILIAKDSKGNSIEEEFKKPAVSYDVEEPEKPTDPTDPTDSTDPTDPTDPTEPTDPTDPTEPEKPYRPGNGGGGSSSSNGGKPKASTPDVSEGPGMAEAIVPEQPTEEPEPTEEGLPKTGDRSRSNGLFLILSGMTAFLYVEGKRKRKNEINE